MIKTVEIFTRKDDMTREEFLAQLHAHAEGAKNIPGIKGYLIDEVIPTVARKDIKAFKIPQLEAIVETYFEDLDALRAVRATEEMQAFLAARAPFVGTMKTLVAVEHVFIPIGEVRPALKNVAFVSRHNGMTVAEFLEEWLVLHGPMALKVPHLDAFIPNEAIIVLDNPEGCELMDTDYIEGMAFAYFGSVEQEADMVASPEAKEWFKHGGVNVGRVKGLDAWEKVVIAPQA